MKFIYSNHLLRKCISIALISCIVVSLASVMPARVSAASLPYQDPTLSINARVADLLSRMTLDEKVGQMLQVERLSASTTQVKDHLIGSVLSGGGSTPTPNTPTAWADTIDAFQYAAMQTRLQIPIIYGVDAVHGHNNVYGATIFPHNVGLGATRDSDLVKRIGAATAKEVRTTGIQWNFSPCLCAPQDIRWGRTYEGFSENASLVSQLGVAYTQGLQGLTTDSGFLKGTKVAGSIKHWVGDGSTTNGDDQGNVTLSEQELDPYIQPYREAIDAGARTVMISLTTWNNIKAHADHHLITEMLKQGLNFTGMVVSDWNGTYSLVNQGYYSNYSDALKATVNAGIDMFMEPDSWQSFIPTLKNLVNTGQVTQARIDDAVSRILRVKFEAGIFEAPYTDRSLISGGTFGGVEHRAIAREAVRKSATLLKNEGHILPLSKASKVFVAGTKANNIGYQSGGWTITWQGSPGNITPGTTILQGIQSAATNSANVTYSAAGTGAAGNDVAIVVIGEYPSAEMVGDVGPGQPRADLELSTEDITLLNNVKSSGVPMVVIMLSGRPMIVTNQLPDWKGFIAGWLPGTEGNGLADVLFGDYDFIGKLPLTWPRSMSQIPNNSKDSNYSPLFPYGFGLSSSAMHTKDSAGVIEAENHNASFGVQTEAALDSNGGLNVGYIDAGDWMDYRINVPVTGTYKARLRVASQTGSANAILLKNGSTTLATYSVPNTGGWQTWTTLSQNVTLSAGVQTLRLQAAASGWNLNWLELIPTTAVTSGNLLANSSFETGSAASWTSWNNGTNAQNVDTDAPRSGSYKMVYWAATAYQQLTKQSLSVPNGTYKLSAWARSSGGQKKLNLFAKQTGAATELSAIIASNASDGWTKYTIDNIKITNGQIEIGVWADANANNWAVFDDFELVPANLLSNGGLEWGNASGWTDWHGGPAAQFIDKDQTFNGSYKLSHYASSAYTQLTSQNVAVPNGTYKYSIWVRSGGGFNAIQLVARGYGGTELNTQITGSVGNWTQYTINSIPVTSGQVEVGVWSDGNAGNWAAFDHFELTKQ
ncbi:glycoside hydrolase family 3 N-terminal domain-containing protein [Paenibacillus sinopodophylli]|uniref:glycoside hydrolase family 3 N-terminal domain-containing protein n=1 Tax=Paenibacillus sinopodophylli TaxID=1837342 RepID=UPI00110CB82B|nr:glycoside hydrolase family 3 N-terminal domain-containing protein [Paenibacillus sinopodophylli]